MSELTSTRIREAADRLGLTHLPDHVTALVRAEVDRERHRVALVAALESRGYEVRDDTRLTSLALDCAVRHPGHSRWAVGIRLNGPNLFVQPVPYRGEIPEGDYLAQAEVHSAVRIWVTDWVSDSDAFLVQIDQLLVEGIGVGDVRPGVEFHVWFPQSRQVARSSAAAIAARSNMRQRAATCWSGRIRYVVPGRAS